MSNSSTVQLEEKTNIYQAFKIPNIFMWQTKWYFGGAKQDYVLDIPSKSSKDLRP